GREKVPSVTTESTPFEMGKALLLRPGHDGTVVASGMMVAPALLAAERLAKEDGLDVRVLCVHTVKPLDEAAVLLAARETAVRVTLGFLLVLAPVFGLAAALSAWDRATFATYLALLPVGFAWLCFLDLRWGVSARMSRFPGRAGRGDGNDAGLGP